MKFAAGARVTYIGRTINPAYSTMTASGTVMKVTRKSVIVHWDALPGRPRKYQEHNLELLPMPGARLGAVFGRDFSIRFELSRFWGDTARPSPSGVVAWLMLNPSSADGKRDDPTARRVSHFTKAWGYDGWVGVNLLPFVTAEPREAYRLADWQRNGPDFAARDDMQANRRVIERVARGADLRVVAFGNTRPSLEPWLEQCLEAFQQPSNIGADGRLYCLGTTAAGAPTHPLARGKHRVPDTATAIEWRRK